MTHRSCRAPARLACLAALLSAWGSSAQAQTRTSSVTGEVGITATAVRSAGTSSLGTTGTELVTATSAAMTVHRGAGLTRADGTLRVTELHYVRGQLSDRLVPTGNMLLSTRSPGTGLGLDVNAGIQQVKASQVNQPVNPIQRGDAYNSGQLQFRPYWERDLGNDFRVNARLNRSLLQNWTYGQGNTTPPPADTRVSDDSLSLTRRATPFGYSLEWRQQRTAVRDAAAPDYGERNLRAVFTHALNARVQAGLVYGQTRTENGLASRTDALYGARLVWLPTPRSRLNADVENRYWGRAERLSYSTSGERLSLSLDRARDATTLANDQLSAASTGAAAAADAATTTASGSAGTPTTGPVTPVAGLAPSVGNGVVERDAIGGSMAYRFTRRNTFTATGGFIRSRPLSLGPGTNGPLLGSTTRAHYLSLSVDHRLTPSTSWNLGARWDRSWNIPLNGTGAALSREFTWKTGLNTLLNPRTSATMGIQREITHRTSLPDTSDTQMYLGLNHRL